jgi:hypothetical protein
VRLASTTEIRTALGYDNIGDIVNAINAELASTTKQLAALIRVDSFDLRERADTFRVGDTPFLDHVPRLRLLLSCGFVDPSTVRVLLGDSVAAIDAGQFTEVVPDAVDAAKGVIADYHSDYSYRFVQVIYTAGFDNDLANPGQYVLDDVPFWLQEAAKLNARIMLAGNPLMTSGDKGAPDTTPFQKQLSQIVTPRIRYVPSALQPIIRE